MKIAFQGERGNYSEAAAARMFANEDIATVPMRNYKAIFDALAASEVEYAVARLENSLSGANTQLFDHLRQRKLFILRETRITEIYNLAGHKGVQLKDVRRIYAHPLPLSLCQDFLEGLRGVDIITRFDSASAAEDLLKRADKSEATVCSDYAASIYGLHIIQRGVQSEGESVTRHVAIGRQIEIPPQTSDDPQSLILFELKNVAGALLNVLQVMKKYNISVHHMGSRPSRTTKGEYMIAMEFPGRGNEKHVTAALKEMKPHTTYLQFIGSYDKVELGTSSGRFQPFRLNK